AKNAARDEAHDELVVADDQRVTGVGPPRIADDDVRVLRAEIDDFALALVTPLRPHDHHRRHPTSPVRSARFYREPRLSASREASSGSLAPSKTLRTPVESSRSSIFFERSFGPSGLRTCENPHARA